MSTAVVLFSGGLDSTTLLWYAAKQTPHDNVVALTMRYGSDHMDAETNASIEIFKRFKEAFPSLYGRHHVIEVPSKIFKGSGSSLMGEKKIEDGPYLEDGPSPTSVPFRNGTFISIAAAYATRYEDSVIYTSVHANDHNRWSYPDCSPEFMGAMANAVFVASVGKTRLATPYIWVHKFSIVKSGMYLGAPLAYSWSCYKGGKAHCGVCPTCRERREAFKIAQVMDPTKYLVEV